MGIAVWVFSSILLQARRWKLLLSGLNVEIPQKLLNLYQMIGLMFNTAMPGAVGGDLVKALYIVDKQKNQTLAQSLAAVTMDRLLGMLIIMVLGMITAFIDVEHTFANPAILTLLLFTTSVFVGLCVFLASPPPLGIRGINI